MRIGQIAPRAYPIPPVKYGGIENALDGLCRGLQAQGHQVLLAAIPGSRCPVPKEIVRSSQSQAADAADAAYILEAYARLEGKVDLIHDHTGAGFLIANPSVPVITTNHNLFTPERRLLYREATQRGVGVVAISDSHASTAHLPIAGVVHNGVDVESIPVGKGDGGYAMVLARMSPDKGIAEAIRIAKDAKVRLKIAAKMQTPVEQEYFRREVYDLIDGDLIDFVSEVDARRKYELLGGACALIHPHQWPEPFGMALIEALACGTPVITSLMGAAPEIVTHGHTGYLFNHWSQMSVALEKLGSIDRAACRAEAETRFGIDRMAANYLALYGARLEQKEAA